MWATLTASLIHSMFCATLTQYLGCQTCSSNEIYFVGILFSSSLCPFHLDHQAQCQMQLELSCFNFQKQEDGVSRLKRVILIGDHHQLPPVVKNPAFQKYSHLDQSLFTRFVRLGTPSLELDAQGRARPSLAKLYNWRYRNLGDLPLVKDQEEYRVSIYGFQCAYLIFVSCPFLEQVA